MRVTALLLFFICINAQSFAQGAADDDANRIIKSPDDLGRQIYHAIQNDRYDQAKSASALMLSQKDMKQIGHDLIKTIKQRIKAGAYEDPADGQAIIQGIKGTFLNEQEIKKQFAKLEQEEKNFKESFIKMKATAKNLGFDWLKTKYLRTDSSSIKPDKHVPLPVGDLYVHFMAKKREYRIKLPNCANPPNLGWLMDSDPLSLEPLNKK